MIGSRPGTTKLLLPLLVLLLGSTSARAWTPATRIRIVDEAVRLLPTGLRLALEHQREALRRGLLEPVTDEDSPIHRPSADGGSLDTEIAARLRALQDAVSTGSSFKEIARRFGALAHFVEDAGFPPNAAGRAGASHYAHFGAFCESRTARFPLVFYGHDDEDLRAGDDRAFARHRIARARDEDAQIARSYASTGTPLDPAAFDDRSVPFAVGSLSYSRSVTDVVRAWLTAWGRAGGDLRGTPYLDSARVYRRPKKKEAP